MKIPVGLSFLLAFSLLAVNPAAAQVCGDYARDVGEDCDDGNARNLDGCDASCKFEQVHRITDFRLQRVTDSTCTANQFGGAFTVLGLASTNNGINAGVQSGATSVLFQLRNLDDLTGTSDAAVDVGILASTPVLPGAGPYNGNSDADWWHAVDKTLIDAQRLPLNQLAGSITGSTLTAGPGSIRLNMLLAGGPASFAVSGVTLTAPVGASTTPASATGAMPPGHLAVEHLDPALQSFGTAGVASPPSGKLCGNVSALSMALTPVPPALRTGPAACTQGYTLSNSLLDVFIGGCTVNFVGNALVPTQPDTTDPATPSPGGTGPWVLSADPTTKVVNECRDSLGAVMDLTTCLTHVAYSTFFRFATNRVIAGDDRILRDSFESGDMSAWSAANTDGGDLTVDPSAAMNGGTQGLLGNIDDTVGLFVEDQLPEDENRYRASFWFDPAGFDPGESLNHRRARLFIAFEDGPRRLAAIVLRRLSGQFAVMGRARQDDNSQVNTPFFDITPGPHRVEIDWLRSSGPDANDGRFVLSLDGVVVSTLTGLDNSVSSVDFARLGALSVKVGAAGTLKWDHFESNRMSATTP